jgi:hypothetical protein
VCLSESNPSHLCTPAQIAFLQVITTVRSTLGVPFPSAWLTVLSWLSWVNFDFTSVVSPGCLMGGFNYYTRLMVVTLLPLGVILSISVLATVLGVFFFEKRGMLRRYSITVVLWLLFIICTSRVRS